jgi:hypothetical protein
VKLYIANTTTQNWEINYRLPERDRPSVRKVPAGQQLILVANGSTPEVDMIIEHLRKYGGRDVSEVPKVRTFIGIVYSVDKPIDPERMMVAHEQNLVALIKQGEEIRKEAAVAIDEKLQEQTEGRAKLMDTSIIEVVKPGEKSPKDLNRQKLIVHEREGSAEDPDFPEQKTAGRRGRRS